MKPWRGKSNGRYLDIMKAHWNEKQQTWIASVGSGKNRRFAKCRICGEEGRLLCEQRLKRLVEETEGPEPPAPGSFTEFVEEVWWPTKANRSQYTKDSYRSKILTHMTPFFGKPICHIGVSEVQPWVNGLALSPKTVHDTYGVLANILQLAYRTKKTADDSYRLVSLPEVEIKEPVRLGTEETRLLMDGIKGTWLEGPVYAGLMLGLRRGEAGALSASDIVLTDVATITVRKNRTDHGVSQRLKNKRAGHGRTITAPRSIGERLLSFHRPGSIFLFLGEHGKPFSLGMLTKTFPKACFELTGRRTQFKDLRSTCASNLKALGVPREVRMDILGHTTTEAHAKYINDSGEQMMSALARLEAM